MIDNFCLLFGKIVLGLLIVGASLWLVLFLIRVILRRIGMLGHFANFVSDKAVKRRRERQQKRIDHLLDPLFLVLALAMLFDRSQKKLKP